MLHDLIELGIGEEDAEADCISDITSHESSEFRNCFSREFTFAKAMLILIDGCRSHSPA